MHYMRRDQLYQGWGQLLATVLLLLVKELHYILLLQLVQCITITITVVPTCTTITITAIHNKHALQ